MVKWVVFSFEYLLFISMTSISPEFGHPTSGKLAPNIQNAGHAPLPTGGFNRASTFPYLNSNLLSVLILPEVIVPLRLPHDGGLAHCALIVRLPPPTETLFVELVYNCHSSLPQPKITTIAGFHGPVVG